MTRPEPLWTVIRYSGGIDEPPAFHIRTPYGWAMLRFNADRWTPPPGYALVRKGEL